MLDGLKKRNAEVPEAVEEEIAEEIEEEIAEEITPLTEEEIAPLTEEEIYKDTRFTIHGREAIAQAKAEGRLVEFASKMPPPKKREKMLIPNTRVNNTDTWSKYVYREANGINDWKLGSDWARFSEEMTGFRKAKLVVSQQNKQDRSTDPANQLQSKLKKYEPLFYKPKPLSNADFEEGMEILRWLRSNHHIDERTYKLGIKELSEDA
jgi:hypothetical protein